MRYLSWNIILLIYCCLIAFQIPLVCCVNCVLEDVSRGNLFPLVKWKTRTGDKWM